MNMYQEVHIRLHPKLTLWKIFKVLPMKNSDITLSTICLFATADAWGLGALIFTFPALAGLGVLAVGIPINLTGKARVDRIDSFINTAFNDIIINFNTCIQYNVATQHYQPGLRLSINF